MLLTALASVSLSCSTDQAPTAPPVETLPAGLTSDQLVGGLGHGLIYCSALPADSSTVTIGPSGGTIVVGPHTLVIPAGALSEDVAITATAPSDSINSVSFQPEGLTFAEGSPAWLTLDYSNCGPLGRISYKRIAYTTDLLDILELLPSFDDRSHGQVSAPLEHFSRYAVSY
jgi:hypothetical protein